jgi:hypothetical protein
MHCHEALKEGAVLALRGAGSKSYGNYKIDTIDIFPKGSKVEIRLIQHKKRGYINKQDVVRLLELQKIVPDNVVVYVGDKDGILPVEDKKITGLLFK